MIQKVKLKNKKIENYYRYLNEKEITELEELFDSLDKKRIIHINSTSEGGGVAQILTSLVPLFNSGGINADWYKLDASKDFFKITKKIHHLFQGDRVNLTAKEKEFYLNVNKEIVEDLKKEEFDVLVVHDPQPMGCIKFYKQKPSVLRFHLDSSCYCRNPFFDDFISKYNKVVFSAKSHVINNMDGTIFAPAIDPLSDTNKKLENSEKIIKDLGVNTMKPLISQVSRFDVFKNPSGVVDIYRKAKEEIPDLQLILFGIGGAEDDPEAEAVFNRVKKKAHDLEDVYLFFYPESIADVTANENEIVNAIQRESDVVLQNSYREAFGLTVTEAMWKGKPVVGSTGVGIKKQITDSRNGFIIKNSSEGASKVVKLIKNQDLAKKIGVRAKKNVRKKYLLTRLLKDHLAIYNKVI
ncbi:MAG: glycosyltransferase [Patescibacteria group bacterium]